jgi:hypothetical protein
MSSQPLCILPSGVVLDLDTEFEGTIEYSLVNSSDSDAIVAVPAEMLGHPLGPILLKRTLHDPTSAARTKVLRR